MKSFKLLEQSPVLFLIVSTVFCCGCIQPEYEYTKLLPPSGCSRAFPEDINNNGVLVGSMYDDNDVQKGFIYEDGQYIELLPPGWETAEAIAINDNGFVLGDGYDNGIEKCFIYKDGEYTELLPPGFSSADFARDINNNDVVLGSGFSILGGYQRGFIYENGDYTELLPPGWEGAIALEINNNDVVVGWLIGDLEENIFLYEDGEYEYWSGPTPYAINDNGVIVGGGSDRGFIYEDGEYTELLPPFWQAAEAWGVNNNGVVIGGVLTGGQVGMGGGPIRGFIYTGGQYTNFLPPGWQQAYPTAINDNGVVVGVAFKIMAGASGFIATPITTRDKY